MSFLSQLFQSKSNINQISASSLKQLMENKAKIKVIDVRTKQEYNQGHISKSFNIDVFSSDFESQCESKFSLDDTIILCCRSGQRSSGAAKKLEKSGFTSLHNLKGGMIAWSRL
jgi:rhodanese-related sulfurtransferase